MLLLFIICCKFRWILLCIVYPSVRSLYWQLVCYRAEDLFLSCFPNFRFCCLSFSLSVILIRWVGWSVVGQTGLDYLPSRVEMPKVIFWCCCLNQHHEKNPNKNNQKSLFRLHMSWTFPGLYAICYKQFKHLVGITEDPTYLGVKYVLVHPSNSWCVRPTFSLVDVHDNSQNE